MNLSVADPHWRGLIIWYFFLGGIAAGAYVMAALADLFGDRDDRRSVRAAYYIAFPLVCVCGILLVVDLDRPERFWHMMVQSETWRPMLKWWSPISAGSWALSGFGVFSLASFVGVLAEDGRLGLGRYSSLASRLRTGWTGRLFALGGAICAFFLGSYTGVLLGATNQPIWSNTTWIGALFLASAASTGLAMIVLLNRWFDPSGPRLSMQRLSRLDAWAILLELILLTTLAFSLGSLANRVFLSWPGVLIPALVVPLGLVAPVVLHHVLGHRAAVPAALMVLLGGWLLRAAVVGMPPPLLAFPR